VTVTRETALRRLDRSRKSLAVAVGLRPGEGVPDVLLRATAANGFQYPYQLIQLIGGRREQRFSHFGSGKWSLAYSGLGDLLGLPRGDADIQPLLYGLSTKQQVTFFGRNLPLKQLIGHRRVAPTSLRTLGYQKAVWHISSLTFDPKTYELLLDHCPVCETRLNFLVARGISFCHRCVDADNPMRPVVDLREFPQERAQFEDEEALRFATDLVNPETPLADLAKWDINPALRDADPGHLFEFMAQVARAIDFRDRRCCALEAKFSSVGEVSADALSRSARAILGWPDAFVELAESLKDTWSSQGQRTSTAILYASVSRRHFTKEDFESSLLALSNCPKSRRRSSGGRMRIAVQLSFRTPSQRGMIISGSRGPRNR
jgi:hypothetical protein